VNGRAARLLAGLVAVVVAPRVAAAQAPAPAPVSSFEKSAVEVQPSHGPIHAVIIDNTYGDVRVEGHDGDTVVIHAFKKAPDDASLERLKVSLLAEPSGALHIGTRLGTGGEGTRLAAGSVRIDLVIQAPRDAAVSARVWNGSLVVAGMENGADLEANDGLIEVSHASGKIATQAAQGDQRFSEVVGDVEARAVVGNVDLDAVRGRRLDAMLRRGRVVGRRVASAEVKISVIDGDVDLQGTATVNSRWRVVTYRGNVAVKINEGVPVTIKARTRSGDVGLPAALRAAHRDDQGWTVASSQQRARTQAMLELAANIGNIAVSF